MMRRIYTRTGDNGTTGIFGGERVEKDDIRIEANGTIDELNTVIGIVRSLLPEQDEWHEWLYEIQMELMSCMSHVATPSVKRGENPNTLRTDLTGACLLFRSSSGHADLPGGVGPDASSGNGGRFPAVSGSAPADLRWKAASAGSVLRGSCHT